MFPVIQEKDLQMFCRSNIEDRYFKLMDKFKSIYGNKPDFIARAPGGISILGNHLAENGFGVLSSTIEKDCLIAVHKIKGKVIHLHNMNEALYPPCSLSIDPQVKETGTGYSKCFKEAYSATIKGIPFEKLEGMQVLVSGNIPLNSGLASSSAYCICVGLASTYLNIQNVQTKDEKFKQNLIQRTIKSESSSGMKSGSIDQIVSAFGKQNKLCFVELDPLKFDQVKLPKGIEFVIMHSLVYFTKSFLPHFYINKKQCQSRIAFSILAKKLNLPQNFAHKKMRQIQQWTKLPLSSISATVEGTFHKEQYNRQMIEQILGQNLQETLKEIVESEKVIQQNKTYNIYGTAKHLINEADRVQKFKEICSSPIENEAKRSILGKLLNESHSSIKNDYKNSCKEVDQMIQLALKNGAEGCRMIGSGWGGCILAIVKEESYKQFLSNMILQFYHTPENKEKTEKTGIDKLIFATKPSEGACIIGLNQ